MHLRKYIVPILFIVSTAMYGQLQVVNLIEVQYGKLPTESADPFPSIYDRGEISYKKKGFRAEATIEEYWTTFDDRSYLNLAQARLAYKNKTWNIQLGNFYETLGNGVLLRSFEFPGALLEDLGFRSRGYFHRDMLGGSVTYKNKKMTLQVLHADVLNNTLPPTFDRQDRRIDLVSAVSSSFKYTKGHQAGLIFMRRAEPNLQGIATDPDYYISGHAKGKIVTGLNYFGEYAFSPGSDSWALYGGISGFTGKFSYSVEYKNYQDFFVGSGINEPPAGVKQQTYRVLNRSIHVTDPEEETGYQLDLFYNFDDGTILNFNHSLAKNPFGNESTTFRQYFLEIQSSLNEGVDYKAFIDYSQDPFKRENNRFSIGLYTDIKLKEKIRLLPEFEYQTFSRGATSGIYNFSGLLGLKLKSKWFGAILAEVTNDPFIIQDGNSTNLFIGSTIRYTPSYLHSFQLFAGKRRGGPQCTAGVCYEILDFQGVELRWVGRWK